MIQAYPKAKYSQHQPQVNALTDYARQCAAAQTYSDNNSYAIQFSEAFQQLHLLTGLPTYLLAPYLSN